MATKTFTFGDRKFVASERVRVNGVDGIIWIERRLVDGGWVHWGRRHTPLRASRREVVERFDYRNEVYFA